MGHPASRMVASPAMRKTAVPAVLKSSWKEIVRLVTAAASNTRYCWVATPATRRASGIRTRIARRVMERISREGSARPASVATGRRGATTIFPAALGWEQTIIVPSVTERPLSIRATRPRTRFGIMLRLQAGGYNVTTSTLATVGQPSRLIATNAWAVTRGPLPSTTSPAPPSSPPSEFIAGAAAFGAESRLSPSGKSHLRLGPSGGARMAGSTPRRRTPSNLSLNGTIAQDMLDSRRGNSSVLPATTSTTKAKPKYSGQRIAWQLCFTCHDFTPEARWECITSPIANNPWDSLPMYDVPRNASGRHAGRGRRRLWQPHARVVTTPLPRPTHHRRGITAATAICHTSIAPRCHADPLTGVLTGNNFGVLIAPSCTKCTAPCGTSTTTRRPR